MKKHEVAERAAFRTYLVLVHMADFEGISLSDVGKDQLNIKIIITVIMMFNRPEKGSAR